ncbi:uncharacterized protein YmfQ (DUF2313 family) [Paenibacillus forsythiae]|uniref:Uncharacterized protein YmfQ (DUF2313 family) n=1 Tax=Paenibacillus forsythiae TaxID=365616 RepID=A0ABU3HA37_9BACL|nr:YmfQ family protein [Paenibacillus forsythiae]MDT3427689.1 uncharacterized protein YmfQ (DUF2313 family) [Paenibacillus forsythiae]
MPYGNELYGAGMFSAQLNEQGYSGQQPVDLMEYLPPYYRDVREMEELQATVGEELGNLQGAAKDVLDQFFLETSTWSLARREAELGLVTDPSKSYTWRREMILAKLRGTGKTTPQMVERVASAFSGGNVVVEDVPGEYRFIVRFVGVLGIPPNMTGLMQILEEIKPAHLAYEFAYTYTFWATLKAMTWTTAGTRTWNELRTYG